MAGIDRKRHKLLEFLFIEVGLHRSSNMKEAIDKFKWTDETWASVLSDLSKNKEIMVSVDGNGKAVGIKIHPTNWVSAFSNKKYKLKFDWWNFINTIIAATGLGLAAYALAK